MPFCPLSAADPELQYLEFPAGSAPFMHHACVVALKRQWVGSGTDSLFLVRMRRMEMCLLSTFCSSLEERS